MLKDEAAWLQAQGLGLRPTCRDLLVFDADGPIDNRLRFEDECVRHKLLDMVGDLALAGCELVGRFIAYRSGRLNAELVKTLLDQSENGEGFEGTRNNQVLEHDARSGRRGPETTSKSTGVD